MQAVLIGRFEQFIRTKDSIADLVPLGNANFGTPQQKKAAKDQSWAWRVTSAIIGLSY
jgi:hypothetical protein